MISTAIIFHFLIFQAMFIVKNRMLSKKIGKSIRGKNKEAVASIVLIAITTSTAFVSILSDSMNEAFLPFHIFNAGFFKYTGVLLLIFSLVISFMALMQMKDSWRIGIKEDDKTDLVTGGVYKMSRNPYFLSYDLMFIGYILLITNSVVIFFSILSIISIHIMIRKEESFLESLHGEKYINYKKDVPRYFIV